MAAMGFYPPSFNHVFSTKGLIANGSHFFSVNKKLHLGLRFTERKKASMKKSTYSTVNWKHYQRP